MKKVFFALAATCLGLVACNKQVSAPVFSENGKSEISFMSVANITKAGGDYVESDAFEGSPFDALHYPSFTTTVANSRKMQISAYLYPQSGVPGTYFEGYTYARDLSAGATDALWHNYVGDVMTPIYWPIGGTMDFLAYSTLQPFADGAVVWDEDNVANAVTIEVNADYKQDDILFASEAARRIKPVGSSTNNPTVDLVFQHAQAWIQFALSATQESVIKVKDIKLEDIYEAGSLTISNNGGKALANWNFRNQTKADVVMDDTFHKYNTYLKVKDDAKVGLADDTVAYLDMLIPEQPKTSILITYTLEGQSNELTYRYDLAHENWLMGNKYIYQICFGINEITVKPVVTPFAAGNVTDFSPVDPS